MFCLYRYIEDGLLFFIKNEYNKNKKNYKKYNTELSGKDFPPLIYLKKDVCNKVAINRES